MSIRLLIIFVFIGAIKTGAQDNTIAVNQRIVYKTDKANEVYLVWAMDNWKQPLEKFWTKGTYANNGMAYSPMIAAEDSFYLDLQLPKGIYIDFMVWASKDTKGRPMESWDNNWGTNYNVYIDGLNTTQTITDEKLTIAESQTKPFTILENGWIILLAGLIFLLAGFVIHFFRKKKGINQGPTINGFITGFIIAIALLMLVIRLQLNGFLTNKQYLVFGAGYKDILFMLIFSIPAGLLLYLARNKKGIRICLQAVIILFLIVVLIASILNIEIVRQLGKPLTYNWLYYSDFLQAKDAKNAAKAGLNPVLVRNIVFLILGVLSTGIAIAFLKRKILDTKRVMIIAAAFVLLILVVSFVQFRIGNFEPGKTDNPISVLLMTWINASKKPGVFSLEVSDQSRMEIEKMHSQDAINLPLTDSISNVVLFMLESTPSNLVQPYDTTYKVTPNINKWKSHARIYNNMYAHIPTTANAMSSLVSGIYPMISYKSIVNEYPAIKSPSLPGVLKGNGWTSSLFFSSDLAYSNMGAYLTNQKIELAEDFKKISCSFKKFNSSYAQLDGLDDRCIVNRYLNWVDSNHGKKGFSILWTNQTHYPYFFSGEEKKYTDNKELNKYLNALDEVDNAFGELMSGLEKRDMLNNTLVIVLGDHGEAFGTHNQYTHAANIYEENLKVPCFLINPRLFNGEKDNRIAAMIDIPPTITQLLGMEKPKVWQGSSITGNNLRTHSFFVGPYSDFVFGSRFSKWKLIFNATTNEYQLYDIESDPGELNNLAPQNRDLIKREYELLASWVQYHSRVIDLIIKTKLN